VSCSCVEQVEVSLQPWRAFKPDGVILFSDILTPLTGMNIPFDITGGSGPIIHNPIRTLEVLTPPLPPGSKKTLWALCGRAILLIAVYPWISCFGTKCVDMKVSACIRTQVQHMLPMHSN
jgi:hypothetical protein